MSLLDKVRGIFAKKQDPNQIKKVSLKNIDYDAKIILAWAKAIEGNATLATWLKENDYEELNMASAAIHLNPEARTWLVENGYAHLMAMIHGAEGSEQALRWLKLNNFDLLYHLAKAIDNEDESMHWLSQNTSTDLFILAQTIREVKNKIEEGHNDIHSFGK